MCATVGSAKTVTIRWKVFNTPDTVGYKIYYSTDQDTSNRSLIGEVSGPATFQATINDVELPAPTVFFSISAVQRDGEEIFSAPVKYAKDSSQPLPPTNLTITD